MGIERTSAIAKKEFKHLFRDFRMLSILLIFPVFLLIIFGYAVNFDVKKIKVAVYDLERSRISGEFVNSLTSSEYFTLTGYLESDGEIKKTLDEKSAQVVVVIPRNFSKKYYNNSVTEIQFLIDGVDGNTASIIQNYINAAVNNFNINLSEKIFARNGQGIFQPISLEPIFWYNPDLQTTRFLIPGLIAMILVITAVVSVSLSLVREKERGTIEQINVSPIRSIELLIGKTTPYIILSLFNAALILIAGYFLFEVEIKGSLFLLFITTLIFLFASTGMGILVSAVAESQQIAFTLATFVSLLPSVILSGFIFPIDSMPAAVQILTNVTPAKYFIIILRGIIIRGVGLEAFWIQIIYLLLFGGIMLALANVIFLKKGNTT
jgi:ABC-2 type transport system permease protein